MVFATIWTSSLPDGSSITTPLLISQKPGSVFIGTNGFIYELNAGNGAAININHLSGHGHNEVRLAYTPDVAEVLSVGTNGYFVAANVNGLFQTLWEVSLPGCGHEVVDVFTPDSRLYAGSNGYVYRISAFDHGVAATNDLKGYGHNPVQLGMDDDKTVLLVGTYGWVLGLDPWSLDKKWETSLPGCGHGVVNVLGAKGEFYAGCNGHVYKLSVSNGALMEHNNLPGAGESEVRLAFNPDRSRLLVGTDGYGIALDGHLNIFYKTSLPDCGYHVTDVLPWGPKISMFACNGYLYALNNDGGVIGQNDLPGLGKGETRIRALGTSNLATGLNGYAVRFSVVEGQVPWEHGEPLVKPAVKEDPLKLILKAEPAEDLAKYVPKPTEGDKNGDAKNA